MQQQMTQGRQTQMLFVLACILTISGCTSNQLRGAPEIQVVTKYKEISCDEAAMAHCEGVSIEDIPSAFHGVEGFIQAGTALDACIDKHASLVNCIREHNARKPEKD